MRIYVNADNALFQMSLKSRNYVDKSMLIAETNRVLGTKDRFMCVTRPRCFGKTSTLEMLTAYYSKGADSSKEFSALKIAQDPSYAGHLNRHNVIYVHMQRFLKHGEPNERNMLAELDKTVIEELKENYPEIDLSSCRHLHEALSEIYTERGERFIFLIDAWDCLLRSTYNRGTHYDDAVYGRYLAYMDELLNGRDYLELVFMSGILPIKRLEAQGGLESFNEFSMFNMGPLAPHMGFTEDEVKELCGRCGVNFANVKLWYDGYAFDKNIRVYNQFVLDRLIRLRHMGLIWTQTADYDALQCHIDLDLKGLREAVVRLILGEYVEVDPSSFKNDMVSCQNKDDVLTLLVHLGYLTYDARETQRRDLERRGRALVRISNREIREQFLLIMETDVNYPGVYRLLEKIDELCRQGPPADFPKFASTCLEKREICGWAGDCD